MTHDGRGTAQSRYNEFMALEQKQQVRISKLLALILRHEPHVFGLVLDPEGYVELEAVLHAVRSKSPTTTRADLERVVAENEPEKRRFQIEGDSIRANYGHSLSTRIYHDVVEPPAQLLHGTNTKAVSQILKEGLLPKKRQYVHLTTSTEIATKVGARRGSHCLILIDAAAAHANGVKFYRANEAFWLADAIPAHYLSPKF